MANKKLKEIETTKEKSLNIITRVQDLEREVYAAAELAEKNLDSQLVYLNYINTIYHTCDWKLVTDKTNCCVKQKTINRRSKF